jgi:molybdopterin-containing oxidoreductase family iron-sulfur binding subunit
MTKLVWDNAALISPATARRLGVANGDMLALSAGGKEIQAPAMVLPGHADNSVSLALGFGRAACGRVGRGVGHRVEGLRTSGGFHFAEAQVRKTGATYELVTTQEHHTLVEPITGLKRNDIVLESSFAEYARAAQHGGEGHGEKQSHGEGGLDLFPGFDYSKGYQWGMSIDLNACIGCNACMIACHAENNIPVVGKEQVSKGREMHWIRLDRYFSGSEEDPQAVMQPMACQQCEKAPCESVCPVAATSHSPEGLNEMVYNRCVGTRYCLNNCPYKVRRFNFLEWNKNVPEVRKMVFNPDVTVRMRGVMEKCNYCVQRIEETRTAANREGRRQIKDLEILTACQQVCPADAIVFGNINDPESRVSRMKKQPRDYTVVEELNTKPRTTYLARLRNPNPELA